MPESKASVIYRRSGVGLGIASLLIVLVAAYANHFHNSFHFDDAHTIENNAAVRELHNIPKFFRDATTFSSLPSNQSYRPLVSTLLTIDYALGHGLRPFWFHLSIFALFLALTLLFGFFIYQLVGNLWIALGAAALYGLHPANADTVNYIIASSEVISTLGVISSFAVYFAFPKSRRYYLYVLPAALAILAKPTAAIFPVLFAIYRLLFPTDARHRRTLEIISSFVICAAMLVFVRHMTPRTWISGAANAHNYLITQPYVALLYFKTFFSPSDLSADYDLNPFTSTNDPRFWLGCGFVIALLALSILAVRIKKTRVIGFGLLWFLIALLPTSLLPLAEVMNGHRTFLPYIGLVIAVAATVSLFLPMLNRRRAWPGIVVAGVIALFLCASAFATFQRNKVWKNEETLWRDVTVKSPNNGRGLMNYGNTLMARGDLAGALDYFHRAQVVAPQYSILLINLAIAEDATNQTGAAEQHFKNALRLAPSSPDSYTYYSRFLLDHSRANEARPLLHRALELSAVDVFARDLLGEIDDSSPEALLALSLRRYREKHYEKCIAAGRAALALRPNYAEAWNNIGAALNQLGRYDEAVAACEEALRYKPGLDLARNNLQFAREHAQESGR